MDGLGVGQSGVDLVSDVSLVNADGVTVFQGTQVGGGGSQPGALCSADLLFTEEATVGTYTATLDVEAGTVVLDVLVYFLNWPWADPNMDNVVFTVGDSAIPGCYYDDLGLTNLTPADYDPTSPSTDMWLMQGGSHGGSGQGLAYSTDSGSGNFASAPGRRYDTADTITATIEPTGAAGTGIILVKILYLAPVTAVDAGFVEAP